MADDLPLSSKSQSLPATLWFRRNRGAVLGLISALIFIFVLIAVSKITHDVTYDAVIDALQRTSWSQIAVAVILTGISFVFLTCYDLNALRAIGHPLPVSQVGLISFSAYAVGNTAGFGPLSGGAIRFRGYSRLGLNGEEIARVIAFVTMAFGIGLMVLTSVSVMFFSQQLAEIVGWSPLSMRAIAGVLLIGMAGTIAWLWRKRPPVLPDDVTSGRIIPVPSPRVVVTQLVVTAGDVIAAASVLYVLLPGDVPLPWAAFVALFCVAIGIGVLSHVPAGLGVFETIIIGGLGPAMPMESVIGALVLYRLVYHILPLFLAVLALAGTELLQQGKVFTEIWTPRITAAVMPPLMAMVALLCGVMLVFSSVVPTPQQNLDWLSDWLPTQIINATHFLSSLLGLLLFVAARGLVHRLDGAYWAALVTATLALIFTIPKAYAPYEAAALIVLIIGLMLTRRCFRRPAALLAEPLTPVWLAALAVIVAAAVAILLFCYRDISYSSQLWWQFEISDEAPRGLRAIMGVSIAAIAIAIASLLRPAISHATPAAPEDIARAVAIIDQQDNSGANLVRMGDKAVMFSPNDDAFIMYGKQGRSWISLYGPIGSAAAKPELIWRFAEQAREAGGRAVIYQAPPELLPAFADIGMRALKLGEMAIVDLEKMDYAQSRWGEQRRAVAKGQRDGMQIDILPALDIAPHLDTLQAISDSWLDHHEAREKGFALGRFDRDFVASQPVAVLRFNDQIVAFATLMLTGDKAEASIDLMRFGANAPRGAMDFLFSALLIDMKTRGYRRFNLGMAPLSGFSTHDAAPMWNHVGQAIFTHGERFYNFRGLRAFKSKFNPDWEPRYLIVGGGMSPVAALLDVTLLIGGGLKGVVGK